MKRFFYILLFLTACQKAPLDFLIEEGSKTTERRPLNDFDSLYVNDIFDIVLIEDTACFMDITTGKNILPFIKTNVHSSSITLDNTIKGRWSRPYDHPRLELHFKKLFYIRLNEACNLTSSDSINCNSLDLYISSPLASVDLCLTGEYFNFASSYGGSGHCNFRGKLNRADLFPGGTTIFEASQLAVDTAILFQNSISDMKVWVTKEITELRIFKNGEIYIKGNPTKVIYHNPADSVNVFFTVN